MRGEIVYRDRAKQLVDFSGMNFVRGITPTDIDGLIECGGKCFIFFEIKFKDYAGVAPLPNGQRRAFEEVINSLSKPSILFVASHVVSDCNQDIKADECIVERYYWEGEWESIHTEPRTLKSVCDGFINAHGI